MFLCGKHLKNIFLFVILSFYTMKSALQESAQKRLLFVPVTGSVSQALTEDRLVALKYSCDQTQASVKDLYLNALAAETDDKAEKANSLSLQAYQKHLLACTYGSFINQENTLAYYLWQLLSQNSLNEDNRLLLQGLLEEEVNVVNIKNVAILKFQKLKIQKIIENYTTVDLGTTTMRRLRADVDPNLSLAIQKLSYFLSSKDEELDLLLKKIQYVKNLLKYKRDLGRIPDEYLELIDQCDRDDREQRLISQKLEEEKRQKLFFDDGKMTFFTELTKLTARDRVKRHDSLFNFCCDLQKNKLNNFVKKNSVSLSYLNDYNFLSTFLHEIKRQNGLEQIVKWQIVSGCFDIEDIPNLNLSMLQSSYIHADKAVIIVLTGHIDGHLVEIVKFPEEGKIFFKIENSSSSIVQAALPALEVGVDSFSLREVGVNIFPLRGLSLPADVPCSDDKDPLELSVH